MSKLISSGFLRDEVKSLFNQYKFENLTFSEKCIIEKIRSDIYDIIRECEEYEEN